MRPRHVALALFVILLWGVNYVMIKVGLRGISPFVLGGLRIFFTAFPAVFFFERPQLPLRSFVGFALATFLAQFSVLFWAMKIGMPSGLASVVQQSQVFFTILLAALVFRERPQRMQLAGMLVAAGGLTWLALASGSSFPLAGFALTLAAGAFWAMGNVVSRSLSRHGPVDGLAFVVWSSLIPPLPFFALAFVFEGRDAIGASFRAMTALSWICVAYLSFGATFLAFGLWNRLLKLYPAAQVTRFALLLPVLSLASGFVALGERLTPAQLGGSALVVAGLALPLAARHLGLE